MQIKTRQKTIQEYQKRKMELYPFVNDVQSIPAKLCSLLFSLTLLLGSLSSRCFWQCGQCTHWQIMFEMTVDVRDGNLQCEKKQMKCSRRLPSLMSMVVSNIIRQYLCRRCCQQRQNMPGHYETHVRNLGIWFLNILFTYQAWG